MKPTHLLLAACAAALLAAAPARAVTIGTVTTNGNTVDTSFSTASMLAVAIDASNNLPVTVQVFTQAGDPAVLALNGLVRNLIGLGIPQLRLTLTGASFANAGGATGTFGSVPSVSGGDVGSTWATITLTPAEMVEASFGDWFQDGSQADFGINLAGVDGAFTLSVTAVPEPGTVALWALGVAALGGVARRRMGR